jgi:hypothetical protein
MKYINFKISTHEKLFSRFNETGCEGLRLMEFEKVEGVQSSEDAYFCFGKQLLFLRLTQLNFLML